MMEKPVKYDEAAKVWHLMIRTHGGTVSVLQNLDAPSARQAYRRLQPDKHPVKYINTEGMSSWSTGGSYMLSSGTVTAVDILGPEGAKLDPWRGVKPRIVDMGPERDRQKAWEAERASGKVNMTNRGEPIPEKSASPTPDDHRSFISRLLR